MRLTLPATLISAVVGLAALAAAPVAQAHDRISFSVNAAVAPGVNLGISNAPVYAQPVYAQPQPVYVQPQPVYVQPQPVYMQPQPVYVQGGGYGARYVQPGWRSDRWDRERADRARWQEARWHGERAARAGERGEARGHAGGHRD